MTTGVQVQRDSTQINRQTMNHRSTRSLTPSLKRTHLFPNLAACMRIQKGRVGPHAPRQQPTRLFHPFQNSARCKRTLVEGISYPSTSQISLQDCRRFRVGQDFRRDTGGLSLRGPANPEACSLVRTLARSPLCL